MSQLRKEYKEFKQIQEQNFREAAEVGLKKMLY